MIKPSARTQNFNYAIRNLARAAEAHEKAGKDVIYLNIGDPQRFGFRPPEHVTEAVVKALRDGFTGYAPSQGIAEARDAVAAYATELGSPTSADDVLITTGSSEAADMILTALVDEGDEVLVPGPGYPLYPAILNKLGGTPKYYHLDGSRNWQASLDEITNLISNRTKAIVVVNPNNPTGSVFSDDLMRELLILAERRNLLVITDEIYRELCFGKSPLPASLLAKEIGTALITLESLSKLFTAPGWRVGWMRYTHPDKMRDLIASINKLADGRLCSPTHSQYAVKAALAGDKAFVSNFIHELKARRDLAMKHVKRINGLSCIEPAAAFYMMIRAEQCADQTDEQFVLDLLSATGVFVVHGSGFGARPSEGYFRMVYLAELHTLDRAFEGIEKFLASYAPNNRLA